MTTQKPNTPMAEQPPIEESEDGDEITDEGDSDSTAAPFDPTKTKIDTERSSMDILIKRLNHTEIDLSPGFQRNADLWNSTKKSRLIESMFLRIPLPAFYFDGTNDDNWLVVDGLQRLSTIRAFVINKTLKLEGLEYLKQFNGLTYATLPRPMQRRIEEAQITLHIIRPGTPPEVKFNIFKRINTGGLVLKPQEIRHALNPGPARAFLNELATLNAFQKATDHSIKGERMLDREFALRFCAFSITSPEKYEGGNMDRFLTSAMIAINGTNNVGKQLRDNLKLRFKQSMVVAFNLFGAEAFRKQFIANRRSPVNKALFECWSATLGQLNPTQVKQINIRKNVILSEFKASMNDATFINAISQATQHPSKVQARFSTVQQIIKTTLNNRETK